MTLSKRAIAVLLAVALTAASIRAISQTEGKPVALGGKSKSQTEIVKKKFPWLLVGGIVAVGVVAAVLLLKKKEDDESAESGGRDYPSVVHAVRGENLFGWN